MANFWTGYAWPTVITAIEVVIVVVPLLLAIAMLTYAERKVLAFSQLRKGPNVVGPFGLLQPFADGLKLLDEGDPLGDSVEAEDQDVLASLPLQHGHSANRHQVG